MPGYDNSAVDGYAMRFDDLDPHGPTTLRCVDRIAAGHDPRGRADARACRRASSPARALPEGADVVIMQEDCQRDGDLVTIRPGIKRGANTRQAGEDVPRGTRGAEGGAAARTGRSRAARRPLGFAEVPVRRRLSIALLSTGDEVREPGQSLRRRARSTTPTGSCWQACWSAWVSR